MAPPRTAGETPVEELDPFEFDPEPELELDVEVEPELPDDLVDVEPLDFVPLGEAELPAAPAATLG